MNTMLQVILLESHSVKSNTLSVTLRSILAGFLMTQCASANMILLSDGRSVDGVTPPTAFMTWNMSVGGAGQSSLATPELLTASCTINSVCAGPDPGVGTGWNSVQHVSLYEIRFQLEDPREYRLDAITLGYTDGNGSWSDGQRISLIHEGNGSVFSFESHLWNLFAQSGVLDAGVYTLTAEAVLHADCYRAEIVRSNIGIDFSFSLLYPSGGPMPEKVRWLWVGDPVARLAE